MSRELIFEWRGESASFGFARIERSQLYGSRKRLAVDASGAACTRASMTFDGATVLKPGMTAQGWFTDEGEQVESAEVTAVGPDGRPLAQHPSTLGVAQPLAGPIDPREVLDLAVEAVLALSPQSLPSSLKSELDAGRCFRFTYCYRAEPDPPTAFLMANAEGVFAVVGRPTQCQWMTRDQAAPDSQVDEQDDLDFEMV